MPTATIPLDYFLAANLFDSLSRVSVPLFAMLSGALLIGYSPDIQLQRMRKRQVRVIVPLVFWSFIYLGRSFWREKPFPLFEALGLMLKAPVMYHLWFIYMIIGIYLLLPLLSVISVALLQNQRLAVYTFALWFLTNSVPVYYPTSLLGWLTLTGFLSWAGLFIIGYYVTHAAVFNRIPARLCAIVFVFASLCTFFLNWRINSQSSVPNETAYNSLSPNVVLAAIAAFLWIQKLQIPECLYQATSIYIRLDFPNIFHASTGHSDAEIGVAWILDFALFIPSKPGYIRLGDCNLPYFTGNCGDNPAYSPFRKDFWVNSDQENEL